MNKKQIAENVLLSVIAQAISLIVGFILNLIVPKIIPEYDYSYWQVYILYSSYVGVLHFGLLDGLVLRYSQFDYDEINKPIIRSQFGVLLLITGLCTTAIALFGYISNDNNEAKALFLFVGISAVIKNIYTYTSYSFQITNRIKHYALLVISDRVVYGLIVLSLLFFKKYNYSYFCCADLLSDCFGILFCSFFNRGMYFGKIPSARVVIDETKLNISSGILLMIANWSSMLLVGSSKMIIQWRWDPLVFARISFAFGLSTLMLQFVNAISVVLFPSLKRLNKEELPRLYLNIRYLTTIVLFASLLLFFPGAWILNLWIPKYAASIKYIGLLFPMIIFSSKVSLLTNNYFKAYREEKKMLQINLVSVLIAVLTFWLCSYVFNSLEATLLSTVFILMLRSVLSELYLCKLLNFKLKKEMMFELIMTAAFLFSASYITGWKGFFVYCVFLFVFLFNDRKLFNRIFQKKNNLERHEY